MCKCIPENFAWINVTEAGFFKLSLRKYMKRRSKPTIYQAELRSEYNCEEKDKKETS